MKFGLNPLAIAGATLSLGAHIAVLGALVPDTTGDPEVLVHLVDIEITTGLPGAQEVPDVPRENRTEAPTSPAVAAQSTAQKTPDFPDAPAPGPGTSQMSAAETPSFNLGLTHLEIARLPESPSGTLSTVRARPHPKPTPQEPPDVPNQPPVRNPAISDADGAPVSVAARPPQGGGPAVVAQVVPGSNKPPRYPRAARKRGQEGTALIRATIGTSGEVLGTEIIRSSGHPVLDDAANAAVAGWEFRPATKNGAPVPGRIEIPIEFRLR